MSGGDFMHFSNPAADIRLIFESVISILNWEFTFHWSSPSGSGNYFDFSFTLWQLIIGVVVGGFVFSYLFSILGFRSGD